MAFTINGRLIETFHLDELIRDKYNLEDELYLLNGYMNSDNGDELNIDGRFLTIGTFYVNDSFSCGEEIDFQLSVINSYD